MIGARKLAALLTVVCVATQAAAGSGLLASALTVVLHGHEHAAAVIEEGGHLHLVLSHPHGEHGHHDAGPGHADPAVAERDHVFEMSGADAASASSRRAALDAAPPLALAVVLPPAPEARPVFGSASAPRACSSDLLRSVVLRL